MDHKNKSRKKLQQKERELDISFELEYEHAVTTQGFTENEIEEIDDYMDFYFKFILQHIWSDKSNMEYLKSHIISAETHAKCIHARSPLRVTGWKVKNKNPIIFKKLDIEAANKGFESVLIYVRFLKLTLLEENGKFYIVSEEEQNHIKRWVHLQKSFSNLNISADIATPENNNVWKVPQN